MRGLWNPRSPLGTILGSPGRPATQVGGLTNQIAERPRFRHSNETWQGGPRSAVSAGSGDPRRAPTRVLLE
jgi:hypothetical protein